MNYDHIMFEITRWCNMECYHCVRGDRQRKRMRRETIDVVLNQFEHIPSISFTGGEPLLAVDLLEYTLSQCKERGITVNNFWLATNGSITSHRAKAILLDWFEYVDYSDGSAVRVSIDRFHDRHLVNLEWWEEFKADLMYEHAVPCIEFSKGVADDNLVVAGRAMTNGLGKDRGIRNDIALYERGTANEYLEGATYVSATGNVLTTCDIDYDSMVEGDYVLGNVHKETLDAMYRRYFSAI